MSFRCELLVVVGLLLVFGLDVVNCQRERVIVGILTQEWWDTPDSYIAASYVKHLESAGARVVPVFINQPDEYYSNLMNRINGLLLPGGANDPVRSGYATAVPKLLNLAIDLNKNGTHFPVWATCVSFEKMVEFFANTTKWATSCEADNLSLPTKFNKKIWETSRMFANAQHIVQIMSNENVTAHYHRKCVTEEDFQKLKLDTEFTILSTNQFANVTAVSIIESKTYPFYGTSFHPEKNQFEFVITEQMGNINHDANAVLVGQYFANFFINQARLNEHHFPEKKSELESLIYNYQPIYTGNRQDSYFEEIYLFSGSNMNNGGEIWIIFVVAILTWMANNPYLL